MPPVALRRPVESDRDAFVALRRASRAHLEPWEPLPQAGMDMYGPELFDAECARSDTPTEQRWLIVRADTDEVLGRVALTAIERGAFQNGRLGYWIGARHAGRGFMSAAVGRCLGLAFGELGLHRVCANIMPANTASRRVLERNAFVREGYSERYLQIAGRWEDHERWAVTVERWRAFSSATR